MMKNLSARAKIEITRAIIADILMCKLPDADGDVTMNNLQNWDSMAHVSIVVAVEGKFDVEATLGMLEAQSLLALISELNKL